MQEVVSVSITLRLLAIFSSKKMQEVQLMGVL